MRKVALAICLFIISCTTTSENINGFPSWYINPIQNNLEDFYGVGEGANLDEAIRHGLSDMAARLMVTISSNSNLIREENQFSTNEEMRQNIQQNIEKIDFTNFKVERSAEINGQFFVEVSIQRKPFIQRQEERVSILERKISNLDQNSQNQNQLTRRNNLIEILSLGKELSLRSRLLKGAGANINLKEKLEKIAEFENQLNKSSDKIEFYIDKNSPDKISQIIRKSLNKDKLKISSNYNSSNKNQLLLKIKSNSDTKEIYNSYITKINIDFQNISAGKTLASNLVEVSGSSSISEKESYNSALKSLEEKINQEGILKIIGITE